MSQHESTAVDNQCPFWQYGQMQLRDWRQRKGWSVPRLIEALHAHNPRLGLDKPFSVERVHRYETGQRQPSLEFIDAADAITEGAVTWGDWLALERSRPYPRYQTAA